MKKRTHSAGGIVVDPQNQTILLTKKLAEKLDKANIKKSILCLFFSTNKNIIEKLKLWTFTKWKVENNLSIEETAIKEVAEEWGISPDYLQKYKYLWKYTKNKKNEKKQVDMFLYLLTKNDLDLNPTDNRHISAFVDLNTAEKYISNKAEKKFFLEIKDEIKKFLDSNYI